MDDLVSMVPSRFLIFKRSECYEFEVLQIIISYSDNYESEPTDLLARIRLQPCTIEQF